MAVRAPAHARRQRLAAVALAIGMATACPASADDNDTLALEVKATYLYKLPPFITWPTDAFPSPASPFTLCVVGRDPFGDLLDRAVSGKRLLDRPVAVQRLETPTHDSPCQLIYVASGAQNAAHALQVVAGAPVLTVTDDAAQGAKGIVNFIFRDNHVRFEIDQAQAARNRLDISSKLLSVAVSVAPK